MSSFCARCGDGREGTEAMRKAAEKAEWLPFAPRTDNGMGHEKRSVMTSEKETGRTQSTVHKALRWR